ncbi:hypothetical protein D9M69_173440 [compost metagenome]
MNGVTSDTKVRQTPFDRDLTGTPVALRRQSPENCHLETGVLTQEFLDRVLRQGAVAGSACRNEAYVVKANATSL